MHHPNITLIIYTELNQFTAKISNSLNKGVYMYLIYLENNTSSNFLNFIFKQQENSTLQPPPHAMFIFFFFL